MFAVVIKSSGLSSKFRELPFKVIKLRLNIVGEP